MKYLYTALILAFLCPGGATAQEKKSGFFDKVKNTFSSEIKIGTYTFKDTGAVYTGEIKGRKPNGKGKTVFKNVVGIGRGLACDELVERGTERVDVGGG